MAVNIKFDPSSGSQNQTVKVSGNCNPGIDETVQFQVQTEDGSKTEIINVTQEGKREVFMVSDGQGGYTEFMPSDGGTFNVIKQQWKDDLDCDLVDAWIFSGYKNEDAPETIAGVNGIELTCNNFAWNEEGSGFKDGALWFDGVDDYLIGRNKFPILTDYTIIMKRNIFELGGYATVACKWIADEIKGNGAFLFEFNGTPNNHIPKPNKTLSFSNSNEVGDNSISSDQIPELISWQTKNRYNGHEINSGIQSDGRNFTIGRKMLYGAFCKISVNYCALYDKSLTESEIQSEIQKLETLWKNRLNNQ